MKHIQSPLLPDPDRARQERRAAKAATFAAASLGLMLFDTALLHFWELSFGESLIILSLSALSMAVGIAWAQHVHIREEDGNGTR